MKEVAKRHQTGKVESWRVRGGTSQVSRNLGTVATTFLQLQEGRHRADYDLSPTARFSRQEAINFVELADQALAAWARVSPDEAVGFVLACLGAGRR